jgi:hypothetical protein
MPTAIVFPLTTLTPPCPKAEPGYTTPFVVEVFLGGSQNLDERFLEIDGIVDHHCLDILLIN